ncbi:hypothetical protein [Selenomonas ruminantium]|uniref:Uncharacterized protein n=1 Tax=Selenomonas ruminantium TaxID=971 RepID=A0A1H0QDP4_SELRU|nr:hypothetical protein [Selenomonas ruminantium]SDP14806.1 hypothetical protein SAMN05216366_10786 [Selenomonas ruminantium]
MKITRDIKEYEDIINLPRPEPQCHQRMPMEKRAAQFSPFAALTGYEEVIKQTAQEHEAKINISNQDR